MSDGLKRDPGAAFGNRLRPTHDRVALEMWGRSAPHHRMPAKCAPHTVVSRVSENASPTFGFNAYREQYVDILEAGILDPAKVVRVALQDAASVAGLLITTEAMVADRPQRDSIATPGGGGMGGMGGMGGTDY